MAKQLYFYCAIEDLASIQQWLVNQDILLLRACIKEETEAILDSVGDFSTTHGWSLIHLTKPQYFNYVNYRLAASGLKYLEESARCYTIEFMRPQVDSSKRRIACARFYVKTGLHADFENFATRFYNNFKRRFLIKYQKEQAAWVTEAAATLLMNGFEPVSYL
ncbi:hypothetical protein E4631_24875 [Hymenobacter sp. UV11]|uniref:hypothetical protein n=1 Tax=Hymenobacter sp. UV11 TaxID=1849735 RepID=UPI00105D3449|nr:hypothetical protein [Hymenobacter sp. UV11]TFZ62571.1 hypothetical protein E4631_24875 [Hymenobacter sp. UV11]